MFERRTGMESWSPLRADWRGGGGAGAGGGAGGGRHPPCLLDGGPSSPTLCCPPLPGAVVDPSGLLSPIQAPPIQAPPIQALPLNAFWDGFHRLPQAVLFLPKDEGGGEELAHPASRGAALGLQFGAQDLVCGTLFLGRSCRALEVLVYRKSVCFTSSVVLRWTSHSVEVTAETQVPALVLTGTSRPRRPSQRPILGSSSSLQGLQERRNAQCLVSAYRTQQD